MFHVLRSRRQPAHQRGKTIHGHGVQFLADLKFGLIWSFAVYPAGEGFRPAIIDWVIQAKQTFGWDRMVLDLRSGVHDRQGDPPVAGGRLFHYGPRSDVDRKKKGIFVEEDFEIQMVTQSARTASD